MASPIEAPAADVSGVWAVEVQYEVGSARHQLFLNAKGNHVTGTHEGWAYKGDLHGHVDGGKVKLQSMLPADGNTLHYTFVGTIAEGRMGGDVMLGEYGKGKWTAVRQG